MDSQLIRENLALKAKIQRLETKYDKLRTTYDVLLDKYKKALTLPADELTLEKFIATYLTTPFTTEAMPKSSGIYAYYNPKTSQLYIGQSVNMGRRLYQHFKKGTITISGHDSEFKDAGDWKFYVLEYIDRNDKAKLNDREAYWIALAKVAVSDKTYFSSKATQDYEKRLRSGKSVKGMVTSKTFKQKGELTNRTRGNNVKL